MSPRSLAAFVPALSVLLASACAGRPSAPELALVAPPDEVLPEAAPMRPPRPLDDDGVAYVLGPNPLYARVRYLDGQLSLNESCAIRVENKLSRKIPPVYVNGRPIGFC
ncbi:MAG: hypothetical protein ABL998_06645 [Planctomycetota bacterium]